MARRLIVLLAAIVVCATTARLGLWQMDRAGQKADLQAQVTAQAALAPVTNTDLAAMDADDVSSLHGRLAILEGEWIAGSTVFLDNRQMDGRPGFFVVTALRPTGQARALLVQRGWSPRDPADRALLPVVDDTAGPVRLTGRIAPPPARLYDFGGVDTGRLRQNLDIVQRSQELGTALWTLSLLQADPPPGDPALASDTLQRRWPAPAVDIHKHHGYAFQWFALSALVAGLYVWFQILRPRRRP
jgi:surfeit locus 1 family protein